MIFFALSNTSLRIALLSFRKVELLIIAIHQFSRMLLLRFSLVIITLSFAIFVATGFCSNDMEGGKEAMIESVYPGEVWLSDIVGMSIYLEQDSFETEYIITGRTDTTLTLSDPSGNITTRTNQQWILKGIPRAEVLSILSLTLLVAPLGQTQDYYRSGD